VFDYHDVRLGALSDSICTALQLTNFWQDVSVDIKKDRIYLPLDEMEHWGITEAQVRDGRFTERYAALLSKQVQRTREFFERGRDLPELVTGRLRYELRFTWLSGMRILEKIERQGFDTLTMRPTVGRVENAGLIAKTLLTRLQAVS
jgi:phytoene synthase